MKVGYQKEMEVIVRTTMIVVVKVAMGCVKVVWTGREQREIDRTKVN